MQHTSSNNGQQGDIIVIIPNMVSVFNQALDFEAQTFHSCWNDSSKQSLQPWSPLH